jgi:PhzF family phenazine biosynthesis protein
MQLQVQIVNAFTDGDAGGNAAGVVLDAGRFSREQKLLIAGRVGLSETAFVSESDCADFKLEFFTPTRQIAHCGHATIATFSYLLQTGKIAKPNTSKETIEGRREIYIESGMAFMEQLAPKYIELGVQTPGIDTAHVLLSLGLSPDDLLEGFKPVVVNTGNSFLIVPLKNEAAVLAARPQFELVDTISEKLDLIGYYLFSPQTKLAGRDAGTRMFAPRYGIAEESATGTAAGPLACFLHDRLQIRKEHMVIEQGHLMSPSSPSAISVRLTVAGSEIQKLTAGGTAKLTRSMLIDI